MAIPCREPGCVAMATANGQCAVHAAGYRMHDSAKELRCWHCRRKIDRGDWYRQDGEAIRHLRRCKEHPAVTRAREILRGTP